MTLLDFISQIGGLLGLFMGFSVISFVEVFYWFSFRLFRTRQDQDNRKLIIVIQVK